MKSSFICLETMGWIDETERYEISQPKLNIRNHLETCNDCRNYYKVSLGLNRLRDLEEPVNLYREFEQPIGKEPIWFDWLKIPAVIWTASIMVVVLLAGTLGLTFLGNNPKTQSIVRQNNGLNIQPVEYSLESSDLDNYYAISIDQ